MSETYSCRVAKAAAVVLLLVRVSPVIGAEDGISTMYIDTAGAVPVDSKDEYRKARLRIVQRDGQTAYEGDIQIKGRGNSTWWLPKKPYKIKLEKKADLFGFGKNKHWVLLANYLDESLMRNRVAFDLSGQLGLPYVKSTWVDLVLNGRPNGNYQFCEHIRVDKNRINVFDWEDESESRGGTAEDLSWVDDDPALDVSGGYLFELSEEYDEISRFTTPYGLKVMVSSPEYLKTSLRMSEQVRSFWKELERAWSPVGSSVRDWGRLTEMADVGSMAAFWLTNEIMGNNDAVFKSRYCWLDRGGKLNFGPVWDFDWGCGSSPVGFSPTGWKVTSATMPSSMFACWVADSAFLERARDLYWQNHDYLLSIAAADGIIDRHARLLADSAALNEALWFYQRGFGGQSGDVAVFKRYMTERLAWLDVQFASLESLKNSLASRVSSMRFGSDSCARTWMGVAKDGDELVASVLMKGGKPRKGKVSVSGKVCRLENGKKESLKKAKLDVGALPAEYLGNAKTWGNVRLDLYNRFVEGQIGDVFSVEPAGGPGLVRGLALEFRLLDTPEAREDETLFGELLPNRESVLFTGSKLKTAKAPLIQLVSDKRSGVRRLRVSGGTNTSRLKLSVNKTSGVFKGSFVVYAASGTPGKLKRHAYKVFGIFVDGIGYGLATCHKRSSEKLRVRLL